MGLLARRNLFHDRVRFAVTLTGIVSALVLIIIRFGLFLGFRTTASNNIELEFCPYMVLYLLVFIGHVTLYRQYRRTSHPGRIT